MPDNCVLRDARHSQVWIAPLAFGLLAFLAKLIFFPGPQFNPPAAYAFVSGALTGALLWCLLITGPGIISLPRGAIAGLLVGFLSPLLMWILFGSLTAVTDPAARDALGWSLLYAFLMLRGVAWLSALGGALLGGALGWFHRRFHGEVPFSS